MLFLDVKVCCPEAQPCDVCSLPKLGAQPCIPGSLTTSHPFLSSFCCRISPAALRATAGTPQHKTQHILVCQNQAWVTFVWHVCNPTTQKLLPHSWGRVETSHSGMGQSSRSQKRCSHPSPRSAIPTHLPPALLWGCSADTALGPGPFLRVLQEPRATNSSSGVTLEEFSLSP